MVTASTKYEWVALYLSDGWSVIPLRARDKRPLLRWQIYQHERAAPAEAAAWWRAWPDANVGIVTGTVSGLLVLDIDPHHGGTASLDGLERAHGPLPATVEALTGGGGRHLYFNRAGRPVHNRVGIAPGIDVRGEGGYVIAPPSVHPNGTPYTWRKGHDPGRLRPALLPDWVYGLLGSCDAHSGHPLAHWRKLVRTGVAEGQRNSTIASLSGHLLWHGVHAEVVLELLLSWNRERCRPPLSDEEVARTVSSIARLHAEQSGKTVPLP